MGKILLLFSLLCSDLGLGLKVVTPELGSVTDILLVYRDSFSELKGMNSKLYLGVAF